MEGRIAALDRKTKNNMPTIFITNPLRALQVENQRLRREIELLRQQHTGESQERGTTSAPATAPAAPPSPLWPAPLEGPVTRAVARPLAAGPAPRPMAHLVATDAPVTSSARLSRTDAPAATAPRVSRTEPEALDDAAARFRLLELD